MNKRADAQAETRQRIVEAMVELHQSVGPKATSISAIAEKAGVQRLTVYRHFPDDDALFRACSGHWMSENPPPDPISWLDRKDFHDRAKWALGALYDYYSRTASMWQKSLRDAPDIRALDAPMAEFQAYLDSVASSVLDASPSRTPALAQTLAHLTAFQTWESLKTLCGSPEQMVALALRWIEGAADRA